MRTTLPHIQALDGLRGVAVALILLFHADHLRGGWLGVDLFFVLSGFLITSLLVAEWETNGRIDLLAFWGRRARRLLPALMLLLFGVCGYAVAVAAPSELERIRNDGLATLFYVANWHAVFADYDYWAIFNAPSPLDHTWSLAIEEQFYLLWPPVVWWWFARRRGSVAGLQGLSIGLALASAVWLIWLFDPETGTARVYYGTDTRVAATLIGAAIAAALRSRVRESSGLADERGNPLAFLGLAVLLAGSFALGGNEPLVYRGGLFALSLASGACVAGIVMSPRGSVARLLSLTPLRWLGRVSYGVYLWHWPIYLVLSPERTGIEAPVLTLLRVGGTLWVAWLSFHIVEWPIRSGRFERRLLGYAAVSGTALLLVVGHAATRIPDDEQPEPFAQTTARPRSDPALDVLLIGDSLPYILGPAFAEEAQRRGLSPQVIGVEACGSLRATGLRYLSGHSFELAKCLDIRQRWIDTARSRSPETVVIFEGWTGEGHKRVDGEWLEPCSDTFDEAYARDLRDLVDALSRHAGHVVVLTVPPPSIEDLPSRFSRLWGGMANEELDARFRERVGCQNRVRREVAAASEAQLVDLEAALCSAAGVCQRFDGETQLRPDGMHFEEEGARWAARWLFDRLEGVR